MPVIIDQVDVDMTEAEAREADQPEPPRRPRPPSRAELLALLRREEARLARLRAW